MIKDATDLLEKTAKHLYNYTGKGGLLPWIHAPKETQQKYINDAVNLLGECEIADVVLTSAKAVNNTKKLLSESAQELVNHKNALDFCLTLFEQIEKSGLTADIETSMKDFREAMQHGKKHLH